MREKSGRAARRGISSQGRSAKSRARQKRKAAPAGRFLRQNSWARIYFAGGVVELELEPAFFLDDFFVEVDFVFFAALFFAFLLAMGEQGYRDLACRVVRSLGACPREAEA